MEFHREWFLDEVRDGFFVPSMMKKAWAATLKYYEKLRYICKKHDIRIYASWGTLISAIRHGGYIPWDDDLDLMILREDMIRLEKALKDDEDAAGYRIWDFHDSMGDNMVRAWIEKGTSIYDPDDWGDRFGFPFFTGVDIFVLDHIPADIDERLNQAKMIGILNELQLLAKDTYGDGKKRDIKSEDKCFRTLLDKAEGIIGERIVFDGNVPIRVRILEIMDRLIASYSSGYKDAGVADLSNYLGSNSARLLPIDYFTDVIEVPYEVGTMPVPIAYDSILKKYYGEYMVPRLDVTYGHDYPFYEKYLGVLKEKFGFELLKYHFDVNEYENVMAHKEAKVPLCSIAQSTLELIKEAHAYILTVLRSEEQGQGTDEVLELLNHCQTLVINVGSTAEIRLSNSMEIVHGLEKYCEMVFMLYNQLCSGDIPDAEDGIERGFSDCEHILSYISNNKNELREVLFVCDRACHWEALHTIWEEKTADPGTHVTVVAMPYKYKDATGIAPDGDWETDEDGYPAEIKLTPFDTYSVSDNHPDEIIYSFPYDSYSDVIAPQPDYYSQNMVKYTDFMVFVTPFKLREITNADLRSRYTLGKFILNPGLVYADKIVVQSEGIKNVFEELLSEMTDEIDWQNKLFVGEYECTEDSRHGLDDTISGKGNSCKKAIGEDNKRIILVYFSGSMLYDHSDAIGKISDVIILMESRKDDIIPVWVHDKYAEQILKKHKPDTWREYKGLIKQVEESDVWRINHGDDYEKAARECDAFYGDAGVLMNKCREHGKAVMWESPDIRISERT